MKSTTLFDCMKLSRADFNSGDKAAQIIKSTNQILGHHDSHTHRGHTTTSPKMRILIFLRTVRIKEAHKQDEITIPDKDLVETSPENKVKLFIKSVIPTWKEVEDNFKKLAEIPIARFHPGGK